MTKFYTYINGWEKLYLAIGITGAVVGGGLVPAVALILGDVTDTFDPKSGLSDLLDRMEDTAIFITIIAACTWVFSYFYFAFW